MLLLSVENKKAVNAFHFLKPLTQPNKGIEKGKLPLFNTRLHMTSLQTGGVEGVIGSKEINLKLSSREFCSGRCSFQ